MNYYDRLAAFDFEHPFSLPAAIKRERLLALLNPLTAHHRATCPAYARIVDALGYRDTANTIAELPFLPVRLFKHLELASIPANEVFKTLVSSGTSGQGLSRILLSRENAAMQTRVLGAIVADFLGRKRRPMLLIDQEDLLKDRLQFAARGAAVLGFSVFGKGHCYALDSEMRPKLDEIRAFLDRHRDAGIFLFGFTAVIWKSLHQALLCDGQTLDAGPDSLLIHGGGWKRLADEGVSNADFKACLRDTLGVRRVHGYYGMVEQTGSIFMECEHGHLHAPDFADILIRDPLRFTPCAQGERGLVQVISLLPHSYPGHSLLSEDIGEWLGEDDCPCGRRGRHFLVHGRQQAAELRGCSDTRQFK